MLNICFSEQAMAVLKEAVQAGYLIESEVVCIPDDLSLGDISNIKNTNTRLPVLKSLHAASSQWEADCRKCYYDFFSRIHNHDSIMIWYAAAPADYCGLLYTLWLLKDTPADVRAVCCSRTLKRGENQYQSYYAVEDLEPSEVIRFLPFETEFSQAELETLHLEWEKLTDENGELRVYWNETVQTATVSYYDDVLLPYISKEPQLAADVIQKFLSEERPGISAGFLRERLEALAEEQKIVFDGKVVRLKDKISFLLVPEQSKIMRVAGELETKTV